MKKNEFKETFSEIPGIYELPKKISSVFETNKGVAEKFFGKRIFYKPSRRFVSFWPRFRFMNIRTLLLLKNQTR